MELPGSVASAAPVAVEPAAAALAVAALAVAALAAVVLAAVVLAVWLAQPAEAVWLAQPAEAGWPARPAAAVRRVQLAAAVRPAAAVRRVRPAAAVRRVRPAAAVRRVRPAAAVRRGAAGSGGTSSSPAAYYRGDFATNGTYEVGTVAFPGGTNVLTLSGLAGDDITGMALSPNGAKLAVAGVDTAGTAAKLMIFDADGSNGQTLVTAPSAGRSFGSLEFSKDGNQIAFIADLETTAGANALYVVPANGAASEKRLSPALTDAALDVTQLEWAGDNKTIAYTGDLVSNGIYGLWTVDSSATSPAPVEIVTQAELGASGDVSSALGFDSTDKLYFSSNFQTGSYRLYAVDKDGQNRAQLAGSSLTNGSGEASIGTFAISPSGTKIAFVADAPTADLGEVYVLALTGSATAQKVSAVQTLAPSGINGPNIYGDPPMAWSPDETMIAVIADWLVDSSDADNDFSAFVLPASGTAGGVRIVDAPSNNNQDAIAVAFSADSKRLFILGDLAAGNDTELFSTTDLTTADQTATAIRDQAVVAGGDISAVIAVP